MDGLNRDRCLDTPKLVMSLVGLVLLLVACVNVAWGYQHSTISVRRVARTRVLMTSSHYENAVAMATKSVASSEVLMKFSRSDLTKLLEDELEDGIDKLDPDTSDLIQKTSDAAFSAVTGLANFLVNTGQNETQRNIPVLRTMQRIEKDMKMLDDVAGQTPQLTNVEVALLGSSVVLSAISPTFLSMKVVEVLVPSMAALAAAVGISAEYVGRVAVANGKEISSLAMQAAAEAEGVLAQAERAKAIMPLCVGISTSASAFALLAPALVAELNQIFGIQLIMNEVRDELIFLEDYCSILLLSCSISTGALESLDLLLSFSMITLSLHDTIILIITNQSISTPKSTQVLIVFPLVSVLSAAIANLAAEESIQLSNRASNTGLRRFASSKTVGVTWKSQAEQVTAASDQTTQKWWSFAYSVIPAPIVAAIWPGNFALSCIVCSAFAAAQAAYYLANAEYSVGSASVQVAIKAKAAAVSDTYANQGSRAGSVLPFTSALAGLCAAASTAVVEVVPLVSIVELQSLIAGMYLSVC